MLRLLFGMKCVYIARVIEESSPLASLASEDTSPPNIRTLISEGKEDTSEM
jgi:hypothetical protein